MHQCGWFSCLAPSPVLWAVGAPGEPGSGRCGRTHDKEGGSQGPGMPGPKKQGILRGPSRVSGTEEAKKGPEFGDRGEQPAVR